MPQSEPSRLVLRSGLDIGTERLSKSELVPIGSASSHNVSACAATNRNIAYSSRQKHAHMQVDSDDPAGRNRPSAGPIKGV